MKDQVIKHIRDGPLLGLRAWVVAERLECHPATMRKALAVEGVSFCGLRDLERWRRVGAMLGAPSKVMAPEIGFYSTTGFLAWLYRGGQRFSDIKKQAKPTQPKGLKE